MEPLVYVVLAQALALAAVAVRWLAGRREVKVISAADYKDGRARTWLRLVLATDGTPGGTELVDQDTRRPVVFAGTRAMRLESRFTAGSRRARVLIVLEGVKIDHSKGAQPCEASAK